MLPSFRAAAALGLAALVAAAAHPASAVTIRVPADEPTIQAGLDAAGPGDLVLVAPGTYTGPGNRDLGFQGEDIELRSEAGAAATIIDCAGEGRGFLFLSGETSAAVVDGFTIRGGSADAGGGMLCAGAATAPTIARCVFDRNLALGEGGGALACDLASPAVTSCAFIGNEADHGNGGAVHCDSASPVFTGCRFTANSATFSGGALYCLASSPVLTGCTLDGNSAIAYGGAVCCESSSLTLTSSTLHGNSALFRGGGLRLAESSTATLHATIGAASVRGEGIHCAGGASATLDCCDVVGNAGGDWVGCLAGQLGVNGNIAADPLFCDAPGGDFTLHIDSPCQPDHSPGACGLIGAWPVGCGAPAALPDSPWRPATWGAIKAGQRR